MSPRSACLARQRDCGCSSPALPFPRFVHTYSGNAHADTNTNHSANGNSNRISDNVAHHDAITNTHTDVAANQDECADGNPVSIRNRNAIANVHIVGIGHTIANKNKDYKSVPACC